MSSPTVPTKPLQKMPQQNTATPIVTIHLRRKRSAAMPANGTQIPYMNVNTVPTTPIAVLDTPKLSRMEGSVAE